MSYNLVFKKGGVEILSLGVAHPLSAAFNNKPYDKFEPMPRTAFADAMHDLIRQDESLEDDYEIMEKMLAYTPKQDELWDLVSRLNEIKKERKAIANAKVMLHMLEMIWEEGAYYYDKSNMGLEWAVI